MAVRVSEIPNPRKRSPTHRSLFRVGEPTQPRLSPEQLRAESELAKILETVSKSSPDKKVRWPLGFRTIEINEQENVIDSLVLVDEPAAGPSYLGYNPNNPHPVHDIVVLGDDGRIRSAQYQGDQIGEWTRGDASLVSVEHLSAMGETLCRTYVEQRMGACTLSYWLEQQPDMTGCEIDY